MWGGRPFKDFKTPAMEKRLKFLAFRIPLLCFVESFSVCLLPEPASLPLTKAFLQPLVLSAANGCIWDLSAVTYHPRDFTSMPSNSVTGREMSPVTCITVYQRMMRTHAMTTLSQFHLLHAKQKSFQQWGAFQGAVRRYHSDVTAQWCELLRKCIISSS